MNDVVIVGAGASGLSAAGALKRRGIDPLVLERDPAVGVTWARRYDRLHLHTMREFSGLAHHPIPRTYPRYLSRDQFVEYLRGYASRFQLRVTTGVDVRHIRPDGALWAVETADGVFRAPVVVVATGQYRDPVTPAWPGRAVYGGRLLHSSEYANAAPFRGLRVLVVGAGNSGAEIATDLAEGAASKVALSVRTPPPIVPRDPFGMPVQRTSILLSALPPAVADRIGGLTARLALGDLTRFGMPKPVFSPYTKKQVPLIDVGFVAALKRGEIALRPAVQDLDEAGPIFADGRREAFDAIVAATGFTSGLEHLIAGQGPGLYSIGFVRTLRGHLFEANRASRRLARTVERYLRQAAASASHPSTT